MTGRKGRLVRNASSKSVKFEARNASGVEKGERKTLVPAPCAVPLPPYAAPLLALPPFSPACVSMRIACCDTSP